jgi:hypothetical protein
VDVKAIQTELTETKKQLETEKQAGESLKEELLGMVKERDFYFDKLRAIEIFIQDYQESGKSNECTASVLRIMYATQDGFVTTDEEALAAVLQQAEQLIGPDAVAATASAQEYMHRRASFTVGTASTANAGGGSDILDALGPISFAAKPESGEGAAVSTVETRSAAGSADSDVIVDLSR